MNRGKIYLSIEDLMILTGGSRSHAYELHKTIRDCLSEKGNEKNGGAKKNLTILEYCQWSGDDYQHIYFTLRGKMPDYPMSD